MQNKPNFRNEKMNINIDMTSNYKILPLWREPKNKANSNPIKANSKPIQTQFKPNKAKNKPNNQLSLITNHLEGKPNSKPISERLKMNAFARIRNLTMILIMLLAAFTTLKGANSKPICRKNKIDA